MPFKVSGRVLRVKWAFLSWTSKHWITLSIVLGFELSACGTKRQEQHQTSLWDCACLQTKASSWGCWMSVRSDRTRCRCFVPVRPLQRQTAPWLESCSRLPSGKRVGGTAAVVLGMTYCRFHGYSCGGTVIISPLLLNSLILSYISRARGQEILQCINRSTLLKGGLPSNLLVLIFFFVRIHCLGSPLSLCSGAWLSSFQWGGLVSAARRLTCTVFALSPCLCVSLFPWRRRRREIKFPHQPRQGSLWVEVKRCDSIKTSMGLTSWGLRGNLLRTMLWSSVKQIYSTLQPPDTQGFICLHYYCL